MLEPQQELDSFHFERDMSNLAVVNFLREKKIGINRIMKDIEMEDVEMVVKKFDVTKELNQSGFSHILLFKRFFMSMNKQTQNFYLSWYKKIFYSHHTEAVKWLLAWKHIT